jgi:hypothetical protein
MKRILLILGAGLLGLMHPAAAQATLLDFTFSFTGTIPPGTVAGTVTGEIFGLTEGTTSSATNVIVDSYPVGLEPPSPPQTVYTSIAENTFTVSSTGAITDANYSALNSSLTLAIRLNHFNDNEIATSNENTTNQLGFAGATYTPVPVPAPLLATGPVAASVTLLATGLATLWPWYRRRRRTAPA